MVDPVSLRLWLYRGAFAGIAATILFVRLLPIGGTAGAWPWPDLMLCLMMAWVTRRPDYLPVLLIAAIVIVEDLILLRPPGLWAAIVIVATEFLRARSALTRELGFLPEWFLIGIVMFSMLAAYRVIQGLALLDQPGFGHAFAQTAMTVLCYPLVAGALHAAIGLRKPSTGEVDAWGRRL
jgi:rod shape-determining protein MreD